MVDTVQIKALAGFTAFTDHMIVCNAGKKAHLPIAVARQYVEAGMAEYASKADKAAAEAVDGDDAPVDAGTDPAADPSATPAADPAASAGDTPPA